MRGLVGLRRLCGVLAAAVLLAGGPAVAQRPPAGPPETLTIGYLQLQQDPRYDDLVAYARIQLRPLFRPIDGAELGIIDAAQVGGVLGVEFALERISADDGPALAVEALAAIDRGINFFVIDAPPETILQVADAATDRAAVFFNATAQEDALRGAECRANVLHTIPSYAMLTDAMVQYLVTKNWTTILVLQGPLPADAELVADLERSIDRFGGRILDILPFILSNDPREREENNVALMTASNRDYDVVFIADTDGEFGRYVPYSTNRPRPVMGTVGLVPVAWEWTWERQGAPQLNSRFEQLAGRRMEGQDWAAWVAVRAVTQAVTRARTTEFQQVADFLRSEQLRTDGAKGNPLNFRPWDGQLRQPLFLSTFNAVIERAPLEGFLHQLNELDTLGYDAPDSPCRMGG